MKKILVIFILLIIVGCANNLTDSKKLSFKEVEALKLTLEDEYKAEAIYQKVIDKFGNVKPFINIMRAEQKHSDSLIKIFNLYNLEVPRNDWLGKVPVFDSVVQACDAGVQAEIRNAALYDELLVDIKHDDIIRVFISLRDASINNHLPAFNKCGGNI